MMGAKALQKHGKACKSFGKVAVAEKNDLFFTLL